jgi:hypothetical protein
MSLYDARVARSPGFLAEVVLVGLAVVAFATILTLLLSGGAAPNTFGLTSDPASSLWNW